VRENTNAGVGPLRCALIAVGALVVFATAAGSASAAAPQVTEQLPITVERAGATLRAKVDPNGLPTTYYFELGTDTSYGTRIPTEGDLSAGSGTDPVVVTESPSLQEETIYFFRVVATNTDGTDVGPHQQFSTLNDHGLPWGRRYELVSPPDKGAGGEAGHQLALGGVELQYQASPDGEAIAYSIGYGLPDATYGGEAPYRSDLSSGGWLTTQLAPSMTGAPQGTLKGEQNTYGRFNHWLASDLGCAFSVSSLPLTADTVAQPVIEAAGHNLYRRNPDGSYELVTNLIPTNLGDADSKVTSAYFIHGASENCDRVVFETVFKYPGVPFTPGATSGYGLYEWHDGVLRNPATIPGPGGPELPAAARVGSKADNANWNAVSRDGLRLFFTAPSKLGGDIGSQAVFLREDGEATVDVSQSKTATANNDDSRYQMATPDGSYVYFIARYGLATNGSSTGPTACNDANGNDLGVGCDLYRYSVDDEELVDISVDSNPADAATGAGVAGVLDATADGSHVYFAAKGQLIPGKGQTQAQNVTAATRGYNIYLWDSGTLSYVATVLQSDVTGALTVNGGMLVSSPGPARARWGRRMTSDGEHLVFQSAANITGSSGVIEAYRYSAQSEAIECVSCRRDGLPSLGSVPDTVLPYIAENGGSRTQPMPSISEDGSTVFFRKRDALAPGALESTTVGESNLYQWRNGQISLLVSDIPGGDGEKRVSFMGASDDGDSVFFRTKRSLVPQDSDGRQDVYVARVGGGFDPSPPPPAPCDPQGDGSCLGPATPGPASLGAVASAMSTSRGNVKPRHRCPKGKRAVRRNGKVRCVPRKSRKGHLKTKTRAEDSRNADKTRRAAK
jgi:hypothetical protein